MQQMFSTPSGCERTLRVCDSREKDGVILLTLAEGPSDVGSAAAYLCNRLTHMLLSSSDESRTRVLDAYKAGKLALCVVTKGRSTCCSMHHGHHVVNVASTDTSLSRKSTGIFDNLAPLAPHGALVALARQLRAR